jgi:hypothetical protein
MNVCRRILGKMKSVATINCHNLTASIDCQNSPLKIAKIRQQSLELAAKSELE